MGLQCSLLQLKAQKVVFSFLCSRSGTIAVVAAPFLCGSARFFLEKEMVHDFQSLSMMCTKRT